MKLWSDLETFSPTPITYGTHKYAEKAEVLLWAYALDDGPVKVWDVTAGTMMPVELDEAIIAAEEYWWQNGGMFDRVILKRAMPHVWKRMALPRWRDTMVQAFAHSLPGALDTLGQVLNLPDADRKDKEGRAYINLFCKPQKDGSRATRLTHPKEWAGFMAYAGRDITAMRAAHAKMPKWNYPNNARELALWHRDLEINDRGIAVDVELAEAALRAIEKAQKDLARRTSELTFGDVEKATQRDQLLKHLLAAYNVELPDMRKATLERRLNDPELPPTLRQLIAVRLEASMTSTSKYQTLLRGVSSDGRLRGLHQFRGASRTGRWAHRLFQPGNMPRPNVDLIKTEMRAAKATPEVMQAYLDTGVEALKSDCADLVFENVMGLTGNLVRGAIVAPEGKKLVIADLANIEGRMAAWLAGEEWKLQAFRDYDEIIGHEDNGKEIRKGPDLYKVAYGRSFGVAVDDVDKDQRQLGKVQELALGYEGGVGAFVTMAMTYRMELPDVARAVFAALDTLPQHIVHESTSFWDWAIKQKRTLNLDREVFIACDILKRGWREAHPAIAAHWKELKETAIQAISNPGMTFRARRVKFRRDGNWLRLQLPSGLYLCYPGPKVEDGKISYMGVNQYTRKWDRIYTYGGKFFEQMCQAEARNVLAWNMPAVEAAGFNITLLVHDEDVTEADESKTWEELAGIMARNAPWNEGLPLAAAGFETQRYRKD